MEGWNPKRTGLTLGLGLLVCWLSRPAPTAAGTVTLSGSGELIFPVAGASFDSVQGFFGDPRDGGRRRHEGIDVFAARHTPVLAPDRGVVTKVHTSRRGGRSIRLYLPDHDIDLLFTHLQLLEVKVGQRVRAGKRIGTVGNSGNAASASPHLHFEVSRRGRGAIDPLRWLRCGGSAEEDGNRICP